VASRQIAAMIRIQLLTGMRPGELVTLRRGAIDTTGETWIYRPVQHKTLHRGFTREIHIGPRAQELLKPFLKLDPKAWCFSPAVADAERRETLHAQRKTPINVGNVPGSNRRRSPGRKPGEHYTTDSYCRAIARACQIAFEMPEELLEPRGKKAREVESKFPPEIQKQRREERSKGCKVWRRENIWHPNQLRHSFATLVRKTHGLDAAQVLLGHASAEVTEIYAEADRARAQRIICEVG
jgi:integrase